MNFNVVVFTKKLLQKPPPPRKLLSLENYVPNKIKIKNINNWEIIHIVC